MKTSEVSLEKFNILTFCNPDIIRPVGDLFRVEYERIDLSPVITSTPNDDIYWMKKTSAGENQYALSGRALKKILNASGGAVSSKIVENTPGVVEAEGEIVFQAITGPIVIKEIYLLDCNSFEDEYTHSEKMKNTRKKDNEKLDESRLNDKIKSEVLKVKKYRVQRAKTGLDERLCKALFNLKPLWKMEEIRKPFAIPRLVLNTDNPQVLNMLRQKVLGIQSEIYPEQVTSPEKVKTEGDKKTTSKVKKGQSKNLFPEEA